MTWIGKALFKLWHLPRISSSYHNTTDPYLVLSPAHSLLLKKLTGTEHVTCPCSTWFFPTICLPQPGPLAMSRRCKERGRYCAEVTGASILVCAAYCSPRKALNFCNKALNLHNVQPKNSKHVVKDRWGCSYNPKGKNEVLKGKVISPLHDTVSQWPSWVQTVTVPTPGPSSKYLTLLFTMQRSYFVTGDIIFAGQLG